MKMAFGNRVTGCARVIGCALLLLPLLCAPRVWARDGMQTPAQTNAPTQDSATQEQQPSNADQLGLIRALNLSPEQRAQIAVIRRETEEQSRQITVRVRRARRALEQAIYAEHADEAFIQQRTAEVADAEAARVRMRAEAELKVRRVLTPEQFATFRELRRQAQSVRRRQNALGAGVAPRTGARQGLRNPARNNGAQADVPSLFPRQPRQPRSNRRQPTRP
jgi:Spy/CpxP family protein refolding chaperone